jgi:D-serine deaminase-like pyridoxal phosphate-dependent protein
LFSGAGTGTYDIDVHVPYLTEIQSGSYVVMDVEYQSIGSMENRKNCNYFLPAMRLLTSEVSNRQSSHVTVDAGTNAIYQDLKHFPQVLSHQGLSYEWGV